MVRTQIQLAEEQAKALKKLAAAREVSIAGLSRQGVDTILRSNTGIDFDEKRRRAIAAAGRFRSGKRDISWKHDEHLAEALRGRSNSLPRWTFLSPRRDDKAISFQRRDQNKDFPNLLQIYSLGQI